MTSPVLSGNLFIIVEILEYTPNSPVQKTVVRKTNENVTAVTFDSDDVFIERTYPVDTYIQVIEGNAEVVVNDKTTSLEAGQAIRIPAHFRQRVVPYTKFKLIATTLKNGHD